MSQTSKAEFPRSTRSLANGCVETQFAARFLCGGISIRFGNVVDAAHCLLHRQHDSRGGSVNVERRRLGCDRRTGTGSIEMSESENDADLTTTSYEAT